MDILFEIKKIWLLVYDFFRLRMLVPFTQAELDGMRKIELKAIAESKKRIENNFSEGDDILELRIQNKLVQLTKSTHLPNWKRRERCLLRFVKEAVIKYPRDIQVTIKVGLHDIYYSNSGIFSSSINESSSLNILMPDFYAVLKYFGRLDKQDQLDFINKKHQAIFIGSTTGNSDPAQNDRLQLCNYFMHNERVKCYINNICQIPEDSIAAEFPQYKNFLHSNISIAKQLENKFIITIDGNTAAWDRLVWILNSNSVCLKKKSDQQCWYYDLLENGKHYIEFDNFDEIEKIMDTITTEQCLEIIKNANAFVQQYLTYDKHLAYMGHLLYYCSNDRRQMSDDRRQTSDDRI